MTCDIVTSIKFSGRIEINQNIFILDICKACPNLKDLIFDKCGHCLVNNKDIEEMLIACKNLKSLEIFQSNH